MELTTAQKGRRAELLVSYQLMGLGYEVFLPISENSKIDLIYEDLTGSIIRVQVKSFYRLNRKNGVTEYRVGVKKVHTNSKGNVYKEYSKKDVDVFAAVDMENYQVFLVPIDFINKYSGAIAYSTISKNFKPLIESVV